MTDTATPLDGRIAALERRIDRMLGAAEPDPVEEASHLAGLEYALLEALRESPDKDRGHPVLADAGRWRDLAHEVGAPRAAEAADGFVARLIEDAARTWRECLDSADTPDACFTSLAQARVLDLEALSRRVMAPPLRADLPGLRERFLKALEGAPPTDAQRRAWATELVDRADVVLIEVDDVSPDRARVRIARVIEDLQWHLDHVETQGGRKRARLRRKVRRLRAEGQEQDLQHRLERRYGSKRVAFLEQSVLWLIVLVLAIFGAEAVFDFSEQVQLGLALIDLAACITFLGEFFLKLSMVRGRLLWFRRHFLIDFVPSIPFAFMVRWIRALRFLRVLRVARYVRIFGFLTRGSDRIVRKYGSVLNRNIVLYPTREERAVMARHHEDASTRLRRLHTRVNARWQRLVTSVPREAREELAGSRLAGLERARGAGLLRAGRARPEVTQTERDLAADEVLRDLAALTPQQVEADMGQDFVSRMARAVRLFSMPPFRWLPVVRRYVPRLGRGMSEAEILAAGAHSAARELRRHHGRYFWFADLYGTVTPSQLVDRVGTAMVKGARRPVIRLVMFGAFYLLVLFLLGRGAEGSVARGIHDGLERIVGPTLQVLGTIAFAILAVGWWLRRLAGQATDFFTQSARAQYIGLTESIKGRHIERDAAVFDRHVFAPERLVHGGQADDSARFVTEVKRWLVETQAGRVPVPGFDHVERAVWVYRDSLDGALLGINDVHTTAQLLGNPALRNFRLLAERVSRKDHRTLMKLDLERQKSLRGPYLWFSLVCKAVEHGVARLLVDYNRHALPLGQLERASEQERRAYEAWLDAQDVADVRSQKLLYVTNDFTALHFLDADAERDKHVEVRFGPRVLRRLRRDRRHLTRRIFGTYPLHKRPRGERVLNLYRVYQRWLAGGRTLLIPLRLFWNWLRFVGRFVGWLARCVREIRRPRFTVDVAAVEGADYRTALRKIQRMRGPVAEAALRLRARFDPEYLGLRLPGTESSGLEDADVDDDLRFLAADPELEREMAEERLRASRDMVRLSRLIEGGLWGRLGIDHTREHLRAAAAAYVADIGKVRRYLSAQEILGGGYERAQREQLMPLSLWPRPRLKAAFNRYWSAHGEGDRRAAWRATVHNVNGLKDALVAWAEAGDGARARAKGEEILAGLLRHPERISEQLVTLRTVQTLSLIDMLNYREHIYSLGDYASSGDDPAEALTLA